MKNPPPDFSTDIGGVKLPNPLMSASGTSGHGAELSAFMDLSHIGAMVVKSLAPFPWDGYPYPRVSEAPGGMLNGIGLQGPGIKKWIEDYLPGLKAAGARTIVSIWGRDFEEYGEAAKMLDSVKGDLTALEINVSCPNVKGKDAKGENAKGEIFAHSAEAISKILEITSIDLPRWVKLSPNVPNIVELAIGAYESGADAVTMVNTMPGMRIDPDKKAPYLASITGGFSGPALKPVALKAVYECYAAAPSIPIVGVGGIKSGSDVAEFLMAGASAVQVGTATFSNPRALQAILKDFMKWCRKQKVQNMDSLIGKAHKIQAHKIKMPKN